MRTGFRVVLVASACALALVTWATWTSSGGPASRTGTSATPSVIGDVSAQIRRVPRVTNTADEAPKDEPETQPSAPAKTLAPLVVHVVASEDDAPIEGARVDVEYADLEPPIVATTDARGSCRVEVPVGESTHVWTRVTAHHRVAESGRAEIESGRDSETIVRLTPSFILRGVVRDAGGLPLAGARVVAESTGTLSESKDEPASGTTDASGAFEVDGLPCDSIELECSAPRHLTKRIWRRAHDVKPLDVQLDSAGLIHGVVRTPAGDPVERASVEANSTGDNGANGPWVRVETDAEGRFAIDGLEFGSRWYVVAEETDLMASAPSGPVVFDAKHPEAAVTLDLRPPASVELELAFAVPHDPCYASVVAPSGETQNVGVPGRVTYRVMSPGVFRVSARLPGFASGSAATQVGPGETKSVRIVFDEGVSIVGVVVDDEGSPISGAEVTAASRTAGKTTIQSGRDGSFAVKGLTPGPYQVGATLAGRRQCVENEIVAPTDTLRLVVPRNGQAVLHFRLPDGAPAPAGRKVHWNGARLPSVDDDGPWTGSEIVASLAPGSWLVDVRVEGYVPWERRDVEILSGRRTALPEVVLDPGVPLVGRVVDPERRGVRDVSVWIDGWSQSVDTDRDGAFRFDHVALGPHEIRIPSPTGFVEASVHCDLSRGALPIVITLQRGAILRVKLGGFPTRNLKSVSVTACPDERPDVSERLTEEEPGRYSERLHGGAYRIRVTRCEDETVLAAKDVVLHENDDVEVEIPLQ